MCYRPRETWLTVYNIIGPWPLVRAVEHSLPKAAYVVLVDVFSKGQLLGKHLRNADLQISRNGHVDFRSEISSFAHVPAINGTLQVECACARSPLCWLRSSVLKSSIHCIHTADSEKLLHKYGVVIGSGPTEKFPGKTLAGGRKDRKHHLVRVHERVRRDDRPASKVDALACRINGQKYRV